MISSVGQKLTNSGESQLSERRRCNAVLLLEWEGCLSLRQKDRA